MGAGAGILRPFARPALSGFCVEVKVTIVTKATGGGTYGIVIAGGPYFFGRPAFSNYGRQSCTDVDGTGGKFHGCISTGSAFSVVGGTTADGDVMSMIIRDAGGGDNGDGSVTCTICYRINGTSLLVTDGVTLCFPDPMYAGILDNASSTPVYDDFEVRTN